MSTTEVPWLSVMLRELGVKETPGSKSNPRIDEYASVTAAGVPRNGDETAWCSSHMCWALEKSGYEHPRSKSARSFEFWGEVVKPCRGAITVLSRGTDPASGHVGALLHWDAENVWLVGGNQGNAVSVARYPRSRVIGFRLPASYAEREGPDGPVKVGER